MHDGTTTLENSRSLIKLNIHLTSKPVFPFLFNEIKMYIRRDFCVHVYGGVIQNNYKMKITQIPIKRINTLWYN